MILQTIMRNLAPPVALPAGFFALGANHDAYKLGSTRSNLVHVGPCWPESAEKVLRFANADLIGLHARNRMAKLWEPDPPGQFQADPKPLASPQHERPTSWVLI